MRYIIFILMINFIIISVVNAQNIKDDQDLKTNNYTSIENGGLTCGIPNKEYKKAQYTEPIPEKFTINASAYTAAADECGKSDGITASGNMVKGNHTLACPRNYEFGTKVYIEGMGTYICEDRGGAIKGNRFDIYMETKQEAFAFGRQNLTAYVIG
jgi:3D (Asp-Asp-Asp) domain-containing protein